MTAPVVKSSTSSSAKKVGTTWATKSPTPQRNEPVNAFVVTGRELRWPSYQWTNPLLPSTVAAVVPDAPPTSLATSFGAVEERDREEAWYGFANDLLAIAVSLWVATWLIVWFVVVEVYRPRRNDVDAAAAAPPAGTNANLLQVWWKAIPMVNCPELDDVKISMLQLWSDWSIPACLVVVLWKREVEIGAENCVHRCTRTFGVVCYVVWVDSLSFVGCAAADVQLQAAGAVAGEKW